MGSVLDQPKNHEPGVPPVGVQPTRRKRGSYGRQGQPRRPSGSKQDTVSSEMVDSRAWPDETKGTAVRGVANAGALMAALSGRIECTRLLHQKISGEQDLPISARSIADSLA